MSLFRSVFPPTIKFCTSNRQNNMHGHFVNACHPEANTYSSMYHFIKIPVLQLALKSVMRIPFCSLDTNQTRKLIVVWVVKHHPGRIMIMFPYTTSFSLVPSLIDPTVIHCLPLWLSCSCGPYFSSPLCITFALDVRI